MSREAGGQINTLTFTLVTLPSGQSVLTTQPTVGQQKKELDANAVSFLARFVVLCQSEWNKVKFSHSNKVIDVWPVWNNIFQFLISPNFFLFTQDKAGISSSALQLANFSATIARPALLLAQDTLSFAAFNADLTLVQRIVEPATPEDRRIMLSTASTINTQLGRTTVERIGTPLQMAIYDHDEEMVAYFKDPNRMDPEEFQRQLKAAFAKALTSEKHAELKEQNASALDYHKAMLETQQKDAETLCDGLENIFKATPAAQFSRDASYTANTSSEALQKAVSAFIERLADYLKSNPVYNPYILQQVYEIYDRLPSDFKRDLFFSQNVIGGVQSLLPARWLQHFAQGVYGLAKNTKLEAERDFASYDAKSQRSDIRRVVSSSVGVDSFLSTGLGVGRRAGACVCQGCVSRGVGPLIKNYVEQKQQIWRNLCSDQLTNHQPGSHRSFS